jgi:hypothetical protein
MTVEPESKPNQPNEFGFAGDATAPQPEPERDPADRVDAERVAVPSDDLTGAISDGIENATQGDDAKH